ncbi:MAG: helix-turn-helix domain-containing protein [Pyrinomonadaceae bacterium]
MKITSPKTGASHLTPNEEIQVRCRSALELKDKGNYEGAKDVMRPVWKRLGERPNLTGLYPSVAAEVLLSVGILTCWIGSKGQVREAQEHARDLITESITFYESEGDLLKVAAARVELAYCYWCEGSLNEARVLFLEALQKLTVEGNTRARATLGLAIVEWSATQYGSALEILKKNAPLFNRITNQSIKGSYHVQVAIVLRCLAKSEKRDEYLQTAITEFETADYCFKLIRNNVFRANIKNNVGLILIDLKRFKEAHKYFGEARRLSALVRDRVQTAQIDESRAQLLLLEKKLKEAESVAAGAVSVLERTGQQCVLSEVLITHGKALARLKKWERAQFTFQRAIEVANHVGALNKAGLAALTMIEELPDLSPEILRSAYDRASDWLAKSQSQDISQRLNAVARKVLMSVGGEVKADKATEVLLNKPCDLQREVLKYEGSLIKQALSKVNGSVTRAAELLNLSYQGLAYIIGTRHKNLLKERSPIRRRSRKD